MTARDVMGFFCQSSSFVHICLLLRARQVAPRLYAAPGSHMTSLSSQAPVHIPIPFQNPGIPASS